MSDSAPLTGEATREPSAIDRIVVRPHVIHRMGRSYMTRANPWHARWADRGLIRNSWPWRIRIGLELGSAHLTVGFLYYEWAPGENRTQRAIGAVVYLADSGWIEGLAT